MTSDERRQYKNGIWLCAPHASLADYDWPRYTVEDLREMKRAAEERAAFNLDQAKARLDLRPVLDGKIEWVRPQFGDERPGYAGLWHNVFRVGRRKERGRAYIDLDLLDGSTPRRTNAQIGESTNVLGHEMTLRPGQAYSIPMFTDIRRTSVFWLDSRFVPDHPFYTAPAIATLQPGTYVTDEPFLNQQHRPRLQPGRYRIRLALVLGDTEHGREFHGDWTDVIVEK